jgi:hypothetical protein
MISLANYYDRRRTLIAGRADEPEEALRRAEMLEERYFGRPLVNTFLRALGAFPPGTTVMLSTREVALVTHANPNDPWRPSVRLVTGENAGKRVDLKEVSVTEGRHHASIIRAVAPPLLLPEEAVPKKKESPVGAAPTQAELAAAAASMTAARSGKTDMDRAREELKDMTGVLDDLLTIDHYDFTRPAAPPAPAMSSSFVPSSPAMSAPPAGPPSAPAAQRPAMSPASIPKLARRIDLDSVDQRMGFILSFVDGQTPIQAIIELSGIPQNDVVAIIQHLVHHGVLTLG